MNQERPKQTVNVENVGNAIVALWQEGENATIEKVMTHMNNRSKTEINKLMDAGRAFAGERMAFLNAALQVGEDVQEPIDLIQGLMSWALEAAKNSLSVKATELEKDRANFELSKETYVEATATAKAELASMTEKYNKLQDNYDREHNGLEDSKDEIKNLNVTIEQLHTKHGEQAGRLGSEEARGKEQLAKISELENKIVELEDSISSISETKDAAEKLVDKQNIKVRDLTSSIKDQEVKHQKLESSWITAREVLLIESAEIKATAKSNEERVSERDELIAELKGEISKLSSQEKILTSDKFELKNKAANWESILKSLKEQYANLKSDFDKAKKRNTELERHNAALQGQLSLQGIKPNSLNLD